MRLILGAFFVCLLVVARPSQAQMTPETAARVISATLTLRSASGKEEFLGSGFLFGAADRAITAAHVVGRQRHILVITHDGRRVRATVIAIDEARDLALLQLEVPLGTPLEAGETPRIGEVVYAAGAPLEAGFTLTSGIVSAVGRQIDPTQPVAYLQHSAAVNPGSSGGPLVDEMGRVVGINARIADGSRYFVGIAYAVPLSDIADFAVNGPLEERAAPGMMLRPMDPRARRALGHEGPGVLVEQVDTSSPAARAGLEAGDILVSADGAPIVNPGDFAFAVARCGGNMVVVVIRGGEPLEMELDLTPRPTFSLAMSGSVSAKATYYLGDLGLRLDADGTINRVISERAGYFAGLTKGDRIVAINGVSVDELGEDWVNTLSFDEPLLLRIELAAGGTRHYVLDPWEDPSGLILPSGANILDREVVSFD